MRYALVVLLICPLTGCASLTATTATNSAVCDVWQDITWSKKDTDTTLLTEGFPDRYDPNFVFTVNVNGTIIGGGSGFGGGGLSGASLGLPESEALAYDLILSHEGTILEAMWDISNWRIGHGSSTFTLTDGTVVKLPGDLSLIHI